MIIFDLETDNLLPDVSVIHVLNVLDRASGERLSFHDHPEVSTTNREGTVDDGIHYLAQALEQGRTIAGHNVIRYDIPVIQKFYPDFRPHMDQVLDTLVVSRLIWTDLKDLDQRAMRKGRRPKDFKERRLMGSHSLEAWGLRLGVHKGDFKGPWDTFTAEMAEYGIQDPETTLALIEKIEEQDYAEDAIRLEHRVAEIIFLQEQHGVWFDRAAAERLEVELAAEKARLEDELRDAFAPWFEPERHKGQVVVMDPKRRRSAKVESEDGEEWRSEYEPGQPYSKVQLVSFEPGSRDKIANRLKTLFGWTPVDFTPTGKPEVNENTLKGLDYPEAKLLIRYLTIDKRLGQLASGKEAWLKRAKNDDRIHGSVNTNGAVTGRMTHSGPNMAQVPKVKFDDEGNKLLGFEGGYGVECRSLFGAAPGKKLVGVDADGLELRMLGHYMARFDDGAYASAVVDGDKKAGTDAHTLNMKAVGLRTRDGAKTWIYAYLYGAGDLKLGTTHYEDMSEQQRAAFNAKYALSPAGEPGLGSTAREKAIIRLGKRGRKRIESGFPALGELQKGVRSKAASNPAQLRSFDGRKLNIRAQHSALNTLLQGGGAVVMKKALVLAYDALLERGWQFGREFSFVLNVHDEFQMEVQPEYAEEVGAIAADAIRRAGEEFGLRCPLAGSADIGQTWASTH